MKLHVFLTTAGFFAFTGALTAPAQSLLYTFGSDAEGFQNVTQTSGPTGWTDAPSVMQNHAAGGWQMLQTKEFSFEAGGGQPNQQVAMQTLANLGDDAHLSFDLAVDGTSFSPGVAGWYNFNLAGNSDGVAGWTQKENLFTVSGWHNADDPTLITMHIDEPFSFFGWEPGDTWFQLHTGSNSDAAFVVNFSIDNVRAYVIPEPSTFALAGLGVAALLASRRRK